MNYYLLQLAIMKTQQQVNQSQADNLEQFGQQEEEEAELAETRPTESKYMALALTVIVALVTAVVLLAIFIASALEEVPKVHIDHLEEAYLSSAKIEERPKAARKISAGPMADAMVKEVGRMDSSPQSLVDVESSNMAHRNYQQIMRELEAENSHLALDKHASRKLSKGSALTYEQYLMALDFLKLTTFPINDLSSDSITLSNQESDYFMQKYDINPLFPEASLCVVLALTHEGLQSGTYYYALKSVLHQEYRNLRVVVINNPEMGMLDDVNKLLSQYPFRNITLVDKIAAQQAMASTSFFVKASAHRYCKGTDLTMLLRDSGELIGRQVFKVINKVYQAERPAVIFTHFLLQSSNPLRQKSEPFRYQVQLYPLKLTNARFQAYKTKYLKMFRTDLLLKLNDRAFQLAEQWTDGLFEASVEFGVLELGCEKYYLLEEIMYKATKHDIESALQVLDARSHQKQSCLLQISKAASKEGANEEKNISELPKQIGLLDISQIRDLTNDELALLKSAFREVHADRAATYSRIYLKDANAANLSAVDQSSITPASAITIDQVAKAAQKMHFGVRPTLYIDDGIKQQQENQKPQRNVAKIGKNLNDKNPPPSSQAKPSPFTEQQTQFCVFLLTNNNYDRLSPLYTIESVTTQSYSKFRLVILDNKSDDLTAEVIKHHLSIIPAAEQKLVTFRQTSQKVRRSQLLHLAISRYSSANEVVIILESGEELIGNDVFKHLNDQYRQSQALAVYSSAVFLQNDVLHVGPAQPPPAAIIEQKTFRKHPLYFRQLRSFRSVLLSRVEEDFQDGEGRWMEEGEDEAVGYAVEEQACGGIAYLSKLLVRLARRPVVRAIDRSVGLKHECFSAGSLKAAP